MSRFALTTATVALMLAATTASARPHAAAKVTPIVVAAEPLAAEAGMDVLKRGGTAADAAVAVQAMLALVEPQSSSLSGGAFMMYYDARTGTVTDYNGREVAPAGARPDMFMKDGPNGTRVPMAFSEAVVSGRATGVPGAISMLDQAQKDHGRLPWNSLFGAAIDQATHGFVITKRIGYDLHETQYDYAERHTPDVQAYFSDGKGGLLNTGDVLKNPAYAETLKAIAAQRSQALRSGRIAADIAAKTHEDPLPGTMTLDDLKNYKVGVHVSQPYRATGTYTDKPLCVPYRAYIVCSNNVPSGGVAVLQGLRIAEHLPALSGGVHDPKAWQALIEAERLMYADRDRYEGDTARFMAMEGGYLDDGYAAARARTVTIGTPSPAPQPGTPPGYQPFAADKTLEPGGTTHFVIRDAYGDVVSMTTTVESLFGTGRMVDGFFLNNQLTDFSFTPVLPSGEPVANAVAGGKHPRSSMAPIIVFDKTGKHVVAAVGSPGGKSILAYDFKVLIGVLDWKLPMQKAIDLPNIVPGGDAIRVEKALMDPAIWDGLTKMGYSLTAVQGEESGLNGFVIRADGTYDGGSDPRREGEVLVDGHAPQAAAW
jgi:gamma-glutamyltranspeptidase/glutathione hydrolase